MHHEYQLELSRGAVRESFVRKVSNDELQAFRLVRPLKIKFTV